MNEPGGDRRTIFVAAVDAEFLHQAALVIVRAYRRANDLCEELFDRPETHDALPIFRRAFIEQDLRHLAQRHPGVTATSELNEGGNSYHTRLVSGRIILTESGVPSSDTMVRDARFRQGYAEAYQLPLIPAATTEPCPLDAPVYAILLHGPHPQDVARPGFIHVRFPSRDCSRYVGGPIDLKERFSDVAEALGGTEMEAIEPPVTSLTLAARRTAPQRGS